MADLSKYSFAKGFGGNSAGSFKAAIKDRYPNLRASEVNELVEREFGSSPKEIQVTDEVEVKPEKKKKDGNGSTTKGPSAAPKK